MKTTYAAAARRSVALPLSFVLVILAACGGGGSGGSPPPPPPPVLHNMVSVAVNGGPMAATQPIPNIIYATITVCAPGSTTNCQNVDFVQIDTQSVGLRILAATPLNSTLLAALPSAFDTTGKQIFECIPFADGYSWGPITKVDVQLSSTETVSGLPTHLIEDPTNPAFNIPQVPSDCPAASGNPNNPENTPAQFGANAILGVGGALQDCGPFCASNVVPAAYYACTAGSSGTCQNTTLATNLQLQNPVAALTGSDNNGVVLTLPAVAEPGSPGVTGTLYFGVGTQTNNHIPSGASILPVDTTFGQFITVTYNGVATANGAIDAGSSAYFFTGPNPPFVPCTVDLGFYCPTTIQMVNTVAEGEISPNGPGLPPAVAISFNVDNIETVLANNPTFLSLPTVAGSTSFGFVYGLPFFYGKTVVVVFQNRSSPDAAIPGPYMAF